MTKLDLIQRIIEKEFDNDSNLNAEQVLQELMDAHAYLFENYYRHEVNYEGSDDYFRLYSCITGYINDKING